MKKIVSLLLSITIFAIVGLQSTMAGFAVLDNNTEIHMHHSEMEMAGEDCCDEMHGNCEEENHECCYNPFKDSSSISNVNIQNSSKNKFKGKIIDYSFLAIFNEETQINFIEKLNSPPDKILEEIDENTYTTLTGITKSNC